MTTANPHINIFIAYSRKDKSYLEELQKHLSPLTDKGDVTIWYDGEINPGDQWEAAIKNQLNSADIILLLISANALASNYFRHKEMEKALQRNKTGTAIVIPIILRACLWENTPVGTLQVLPKDGKAIDLWDNEAEVYTHIARRIRDWILVIKQRQGQLILESVGQVGEKMERLAEIKETGEKEHEIARKVREEQEAREKAAEEAIVKAQQQQRKEERLIKLKKLVKGVIAIIIILLLIFLTRKALLAPSFKKLPVSIQQLIENMEFVEGGEFSMGCKESYDCGDDEEPIHQVILDDYNIGKYEVTQKQWHAIMNNNPSKFNDCDSCPVERVSWNDTQEFIKKLNIKIEALKIRKFRLPTEAEWEFAARGGIYSKGYEYSGSDTIDSVAWYRSNSGDKTHPVGKKMGNELDLYDMSGNVYEWCSDRYGEDYYENSQIRNPKGPKKGSKHVIRGGQCSRSSWESKIYNRDEHVEVMNKCVHHVGFRLAQTQDSTTRVTMYRCQSPCLIHKW